MRRWAFVIFICGMFFLFVFAFSWIEKKEEIGECLLNERIVIEGVVVEERIIYEGTWKLVLENGPVVISDGMGGWLGKEIRIEGKVTEYEGEKQVTAERISILANS